MIEKGEIAIIGSKHHLETGEVEFLEDTWVCTKKDVKTQVS